jgi:hypothetical protein
MNQRFAAALATFKNHAPFLLMLVLLPQLPFMLLAVLATLLGESGKVFGFIESMGSIMVTPFWMGALFHALRRLGAHGEIEVTEAYRVSMRLYPRTLPPFMLFTLAMLTGMLLFVLPGIYISVRLALVNCAALFEKHEPFGAIKRAWHLSKGYQLEIFGYLSFIAAPVMLVMLGLTNYLDENTPLSRLALAGFSLQLLLLVLSTFFLTLIYGVYMAAIQRESWEAMQAALEAGAAGEQVSPAPEPPHAPAAETPGERDDGAQG